VPSQKERRFICRECEKTFSATTGTVFYRLKQATDVITLVVTLLSHGCPVQAIVAAFALDERTVKHWLDKSGQHAQQVQEQLVEQPRPLGQVPCDELRIKVQGAIIWMGMAIENSLSVQVSTRLWLGGEVSQHRDNKIMFFGALIEQLISRVKRCASALGGAILFCTDGLASYPTTIWQVFREKEPRKATGGCRLIEWPNILIAQVIKQYAGKRVVGVTRKIYQGTKAAVAAVIQQTQGKGDINTAFIERIKGTFRRCVHSLARRTRALARQRQTLQASMYLVGCGYNFCTEHESLRLPGLIGGHKWLARTPARASGLTHHCWSVHELLSDKVPPSRWTPTMPRGRPSNALKAKIARWVQ
jgi:hypothetical protein